MLKKGLVAVVALTVSLTACDVFVKKTDLDAVREMEKSVYVMKKDIEIEARKLKKGDEVRIKITAGSTWVKAHAYPARDDALKAERLLILYLFDDDFQKRQFNLDFFRQQLDAVAGARGAAAPDKKTDKKIKK
jgi:type II secretion system-associated lipoprotein